MKERNGLDKCAFGLINYTEGFDMKQKNKRKIENEVEKFNKSAIKCKNFCFKEKELRTKIYWCKEINKACIFANCPKNK